MFRRTELPSLLCSLRTQPLAVWPLIQVGQQDTADLEQVALHASGAEQRR